MRELDKFVQRRVLLLLLFGFAPAAAQAADWTWQNPLPQGNALLDVWGSSASDVFTVGDGGTPPWVSSWVLILKSSLRSRTCSSHAGSGTQSRD